MTESVTTFQFSLHPDSQRPLLTTNAAGYRLAFLQSDNDLYNIWKLEVGIPFGDYATQKEANSLRLVSNSAQGDGSVLFETDWGNDTWYNFAITTTPNST